MGVFLLPTIVFMAWPARHHLKHDFSQVIMARDSSFLRVFLNQSQQWCLPPALESTIPEKLKRAVITYEDQHFYRHFGVNPVALARASWQNLYHQKVISGGSTLTMQLARMSLDRPRTIPNKILEMLLSLRFEFQLSKEEILTEYLATAPYGGNIRGYLAASYRYFGKKPSQLTWAEAATLAVLPNAPGTVHPSKNNAVLESKRNRLLKKLFEKGSISQETYQLSLLERVPDTTIPFPLSAPHLTDRIHSENALDIIYTTIDPSIQYEVNFFLKQHSAYLGQFGIMNACALVIENKTGQVAAYVGSQDYEDIESAGKVDGVMAWRSSGSILKPFLYALAIDDGLILPQTLIKDVPTYFSSFSPSNASESFEGIVDASESLIQSLNVPAVRLLNAYGVNRFYNSLKSAGITSLFRDPDEYGLPLILGGAEVSAWDVARLYRGMAQGGHFGKIHYLAGDTDPDYKPRLVSEGATYLILNELKELIRPGSEFYWKKYSRQPPIAWKTGTSYGHKDAWAAGCSPDWTIVVWVGNFNGQSNKNLSGNGSAGPLLFSIFNSLPRSEQVWFQQNPHDFVKVKICRETGFYATNYCPEPMETDSPVNMKPITTCPYHQQLIMDPEQDHIVCSSCWGPATRTKSQLTFPPDVSFYLRKNGRLLEQMPTHNPKCPLRIERDILSIIYPLENSNLFVPLDFDGAYEPIIAKVASKFSDRELFWYLDDELLGSTVDSPTFPLRLNSGKHQLTVLDTEGNRDRITFTAVRN